MAIYLVQHEIKVLSPPVDGVGQVTSHTVEIPFDVNSPEEAAAAYQDAQQRDLRAGGAPVLGLPG